MLTADLTSELTNNTADLEGARAQLSTMTESMKGLRSADDLALATGVYIDEGYIWGYIWESI